ncbi:MAG: threonine ammonia-lyase [Alphaproteobacteria bacterium]|nr:MAG: threonine ammonia-lyase [Alphaproteobacteria bacterium]
MTLLPTAADVAAVRAEVAAATAATPCLKSHTLSEICGAEVWLKFENHQFIGAFKERGAVAKLSRLTAAERAAGVIAMSAGNHAQAVAYHAKRLGIRAVIVMPAFTPFSKVQRTRDHGAEVVLAGETLAESAVEARLRAAAEGLVFVHPYDDPWIVAGQGTVAFEMLEAAPEIDTLVIPVGGGGLIAGAALAGQSVKPGLEVVGVEVDSFAACAQRLAGQEISVGGATIAEGIAVRDIGAVPFAIIQERVKQVLTVSDADIERAIALLVEVEKTIVEGAGAAGLAALLVHGEQFRGRKVGLILCGGNIDSRMLASILMRAMVRDGRILRLSIGITDRPGALADVARLIGADGGNILEVQHERLFAAGTAKAAGLDVTIEVMDRAHGTRLTERLVAAGYTVQRR